MSKLEVIECRATPFRRRRRDTDHFISKIISSFSFELEFYFSLELVEELMVAEVYIDMLSCIDGRFCGAYDAAQQFVTDRRENQRTLGTFREPFNYSPSLNLGQSPVSLDV